MQSHEERKARMRAYYQANKNKWKRYNSDALARMSDDERAEYEEKQREYARAYYAANRERVIERTTQYHKEHKEKFIAYRADWYQSNKRKIATRRRNHYHSVVKQRQQLAKSVSEFVTIREAALILGVKLRPLRESVYQGRIESVKTPTGRYFLHRNTVEEIRASVKHLPQKIRKKFGLSEIGDEA